MRLEFFFYKTCVCVNLLFVEKGESECAQCSPRISQVALILLSLCGEGEKKLPSASVQQVGVAN